MHDRIYENNKDHDDAHAKWGKRFLSRPLPKLHGSESLGVVGTFSSPRGASIGDAQALYQCTPSGRGRTSTTQVAYRDRVRVRGRLSKQTRAISRTFLHLASSEEFQKQQLTHSCCTTFSAVKHTGKWLLLEIGKSRRPFRMDTISNQPITEPEFLRWINQLNKDLVPVPRKSDFEELIAKIAQANEFRYTSAEVMCFEAATREHFLTRLFRFRIQSFGCST